MSKDKIKQNPHYVLLSYQTKAILAHNAGFWKENG